MDGLGTGALDRRHHGIDPQVRVGGRRAAHANGLVRHPHVRRHRVGLRVDAHGADAEPLGGAHDTAGNLATIGDEQLRKDGPHLFFDVGSDIYAKRAAHFAGQTDRAAFASPGSW